MLTTGNPILDNPALKAALTAQMQQPSKPNGAIMPPGGAAPVPIITPSMKQSAQSEMQSPPASISNLPEGVNPSLPPVMPRSSLQPPKVNVPRGTFVGDQAELGRKLQTESGISQIAKNIEGTEFGQNHPTIGKILGIGAQGIAQIGDIGLRSLAPAVNAAIPGTSLHHMADIRADQRQVAQDAANEEKQTQEKAINAEIPLREAETARVKEQTTEMPAEAQARLGLTEAQTAEANAKAGPNLANAYAHAVTQALNEGRDPSRDPLVQHLADSITSIQPVRMLPEKSTKENLQKKLIEAQDAGDTAGAAKLAKQLKDIDPLAQQRIGISVQGIGLREKGLEQAEDRASRQDVREHDKAYVQPAETTEKSYNMMDHAYQEYQAAKAAGKELPTGAQSMLALSTHLTTTFGNVKGARVTKDMIHEHLGARSIGDDALVAVQKLTNGDQLSPGQWDAFHNMIKQSRDLSWQTAVKEAARKKIPIDFLPPDLATRKDKSGNIYQIGDDGQYHRKEP